MHKIDKRESMHFPSYSLRKCITICFAQAYQADEVMLGVQMTTLVHCPEPNPTLLEFALAHLVTFIDSLSDSSAALSLSAK